MTNEFRILNILLSARTNGCGGRLNTPTGNVDPQRFKTSGLHSHAPDVRVIEKTKVMNVVKTNAKNTTEPARAIVGGAMENVPNAVAAVIPSQSQLVQTVNRVRNLAKNPQNSKTIAELWFDEKHSQTISKKNFILFDSGVEEEDGNFRIIIFGTQENLDFLIRCDGIFMDGTFSVTPPLFNQLYTIHGINIYNKNLMLRPIL